jgi:hypothetical protein
MTYDKINHWYGWNGGGCPVHPDTEVFAIVRDFQVGVLWKGAGEMTWEHRQTDNDIIAFRITRLYVEPRLIESARRVEELAELLAASTPAPWKVNQYWLDIPWLNRADAALIVAAINALPGLIESARRVERLEAQNDALRELLSSAHVLLYAGQRLQTELSDWAIDAERQMEAARAALKGT